ncbi:envelope stress response membrane protein PspC [Hyphococcus flavus]|uniref:Envelope stress response membrane protein PspC n=1 Tax=Hyphococcus flavus TaxID=1866326 RepID=A0AAE9ZER9_9PROT|nr:envelope stress response membrane protein PspC [Hyphococcus flavus]WDI31322.1 envelope stress response membrane protein PspC [Hyphococcus flavus]
MPERHHHHHHHHWRDRDSYAYRAGQPGPGPNFHRLRRDTKRGKIAGVCAGFSNYFGWNLKWVRVLGVLLTVFFFPLPIFAYVAAAVFIKPDDCAEQFSADPESERFWRTFSTRPKATFSELKHRFRALDARIADLEQAVTSDEYGLRKAFRDLERGA